MAAPTSLIMFAPLTSSTALRVGIGPVIFARSTLATFIQNGLVKTAAINESRFEADGYLTEGASTNVLLDSNDVDGASPNWNAIQITTTSNADVAPDGTVSAALHIPNTANANHIVGQVNPTNTGVDATFSIYAKAAGYTFLQLFTNLGAGFGVEFINFDIANGVVLTVSDPSVSGKIEALANGWFRCSMSGITNTTAILPTFGFSPTEPTIVAEFFTGDGINGGLLWGGQTEELAQTSSLIVTGSSSVTRAEDQLSYDETNWPTNNTEFTVACDINTVSLATQIVLELVGFANTDPLILFADQFSAFYSNVFSFDGTNSAIAGKKRSIITWETGGNQDLYTDTVLEDTEVAVDAIGNPTVLLIGNNFVDTQPFFGHLSNLRIYSTKLTQEEINDELITDVSLNSLINSTIDTPINTFLN